MPGAKCTLGEGLLGFDVEGVAGVVVIDGTGAVGVCVVEDLGDTFGASGLKNVNFVRKNRLTSCIRVRCFH